MQKKQLLNSFKILLLQFCKNVLKSFFLRFLFFWLLVFGVGELGILVDAQ